MLKYGLAMTAALSLAVAASANYSYTATFEGSDTGVSWYSVDDLPAVGIDPTIVSHNGSNQLLIETLVPDQGNQRTGAGVTFDFPDLTIADYTEVTVSLDLTLPVPDVQRHNLYWDFDGSANKFDQTVNDGGNVKLIRDGVTNNIGGGATPTVETVLTLSWVFDVTNGTVDTFFGATQYDDDLAKTLTDAIDGSATEFGQFTFELIKDFRSADFGYSVYVDNFSVTAIPEPASLGLLLLGVGLLRRR